MHSTTVKDIKLNWAGTCCANPYLVFPGVQNQRSGVVFIILFYLSHFHSLILSPNVVTGSLEGQGRVDSDT